MCKLKSLRITIRIPLERIRISIPVRDAQTNGVDSPSKRFESHVKKEVKQKATDSNPYLKDSNLSWRTSEEIEARFESPTQRFESLNFELWRTNQSDSNLRVMDSNLLSKMKLKVEGQTEGFESLSYGFESLLAQNLNFTKAIRIPYTMIWIPLFA